MRADGVIERGGHEVVATPGRVPTETCDDDLACATSLLRVLTALAFARISGVLDYQGDGGPAGGLTIDTLTVEYPIGDAKVGQIALMFLPNGITARLGFTLADVGALYTCRDGDDELHAPVFAQMMHRCLPGSRFGLGAVVGELVWDPVSSRKAVRWGRFDAVMNLLGAPNSMAYVLRHLDVSVGIAGESVWHGSDEGSDHAARGRIALSGLLRSDSGRFEANLQAEVMPVLIGTTPSFRDYGVTSRAQLLARWLVGERTILSTGIDVRADHWSDPQTSISMFDPLTRETGLFIGAVVEIRHAL